MDTVPANGSLVTHSGRLGGLLSGFVTGLERMSQQWNSSVGKARALHDRAGAQASVTPPWSITLERSMMNNAPAFETDNQYIDFWKRTRLKFNAWRHIAEVSTSTAQSVSRCHSGRRQHTGCWIGWGIYRDRLAARQPSGSVVRFGAAARFSTQAARMRRPGLTNVTFVRRMFKSIRSSSARFLLFRFRTQF
jgi:hypothetical protein